MPRLPSGTTLRRDLSTVAYEYMSEASQRGFIGLSILPIKDVNDQSANYPVIPIEAMINLPNTKRAARGDYNRSDYKFETGTYACEEYGWEELIDDAERNLYANDIDADEIATMRSVDILLRNQEARIAAAVFNTGNITQTAGVGTEWSTAASCTPRVNVFTAKEAMRLASGLVPNIGVCSSVVFKNLMFAAEIMDAFKYTNPVEIGGEEAQRRLLAQYFGLEEVLAGGAIKDGAKKGQSYSVSDIWDDEYFGLFKVPRGGVQDMKEPVLGRTFLWTGDSPQNLTTESYREEQRRSDVIRVRHNVDEAFVFTGAGYLLSNITA